MSENESLIKKKSKNKRSKRNIDITQKYSLLDDGSVITSTC